MNYQRCKDTSWVLIKLCTRDVEKSLHYIRELGATKDCDHIIPFKDLRKDIKNHMGKDSWNRINQNKETEEDKRRALQAVTHFYHEHKRFLLKNLINI